MIIGLAIGLLLIGFVCGEVNICLYRKTLARIGDADGSKLLDGKYKKKKGAK